VTNRTGCILDESDPLIPFETIPKFPVFMGTTSQSFQDDNFVDMNFGISSLGQVVQLMNIPAFDDVYPKQTTTSAIGGLWRLHHKEFAKFINTFNPKSVLEIGGAHGYLSHAYCETYGVIDWTIIEPNPSPIKDCPAKFIEGFIEELEIDFSKYDLIVHSHTLEHVLDPLSWLNTISRQMPVNSRMVFSIPILEQWLKLGYSNALNFEHTYFLDSRVLNAMLEAADLYLTHEDIFMINHSRFVCAQKFGSNKRGIHQMNKNSENQREVFKKFLEDKIRFVEETNSIFKLKKGPVFCFGAHIFTQFLITLGLKEHYVKQILDNDVQKYGERLYGSSLLVGSPLILQTLRSPIVILDAGSHSSEIAKQLMQINSTCEIISPDLRKL
jgi:2-polyprenyl-3-methyl-5-hydroxy-6-metoxy-1,4-benzoquinol methylase